MVRWMAWLRIKNSRSSAEPGKHPHDGVQATVTPAPDADPPPGSGQNTGVNGARHAVAQDPAVQDQTGSRAATGGPMTGRLPRPIRYAHPGAAPGVRADEPEPLTGVVLPPAAPPPRPARNPQSPRPAQSPPAAQSPAAAQSPRAAESPRPAQGAPPAAGGPPAAEAPAHEGLGIFNGVATTT